MGSIQFHISLDTIVGIIHVENKRPNLKLGFKTLNYKKKTYIFKDYFIYRMYIIEMKDIYSPASWKLTFLH